MFEAQREKIVGITPPAAKVNNGSFTTARVDCAGFRYCRIIAYLGDTDIAMTALKVQESDDDSTYSDVPGLVFGTSTNIDGNTSTLPSDTDDNKIFIFDIDLRGRKRYLDLVATAGAGVTGTFLTAIAQLSRAEEMPSNAAGFGAAQVLRLPA